VRRRDAAKLEPGDRVIVEDDWFEEPAVVVHATDKGGVLARTTGGERWFPYTRVQFEG
jgi:hypothetical protein